MLPLAAASEQTVDEDSPDPDVLGDIIPVLPPGHVGMVDELRKAHSLVTDIMVHTQQAIVDEGYADEEIYFEAVWVDEQTEELAVILDPAQTFFDLMDAQDMQEELGTTVPIRIEYGVFVPDAPLSEATPCPADAGSSICYYWERYITRCLPETTTSRCNTYAAIIATAGYPLPTLLDDNNAPTDADGDGINDDTDQCDDQPETVNGYQDEDGCPDTLPTTNSTTIFSDDFESGFSKWTQTGQEEWQIGLLDESVYIDGDATNKVAEADDCDDEACIITSQPFTLTGYTDATLKFYRFVDNSLDSGEYLEVQVGDNGTYTQIFYWTDGDGDDDQWHHETYDLGNFLSSSSVTIRFLTEESSSGEDVGIDNVTVTGTVDDTVCALDVTAALQDNGDIHISWNDCGSDVRRYKVYYAEDEGVRRFIDSEYNNTSHTWSGANDGTTYTFSVKAQYNDYTYTDYFASNQIDVPASDTVPPQITMPASLELAAQSANGTVVTFVATGYDLVDGTVQVTCVPPSGSLFAASTNTTVSCSATDSSDNSVSGSFWVWVGEWNPQTIPAGDVTISGGTPYVYRFDRPDGSYTTSGGTIAMGATQNNASGFVTTMHSFITEYTPTSTQQIEVNLNGVDHSIASFTHVYSREQHHEQIADAAFVPLNNAYEIPADYLIDSQDNIINITGTGGLHRSFGTQISMLNQTHTMNGTLTIFNVTMRDDRHITNHNQILGYWNSSGGNSGAPIITRASNNNAELVGMHIGRICQYLVETDMLSAWYPTSGCQTGISVLAPWENIVEFLSLN